MEIVRKYKRFYKLTFMPGEHTPDFVYQKGAKAFKTRVPNPLSPDYGKETQLPVPWDETFQKYFFRTVGEFSKRYKGDPGLIAVTLTIANAEFSEWNLPKSKEDMAQWEKLDPLYRDKIKATWTAAIDQFAQLFPNQQLCLAASSNPLGSDSNNLAEEILEYGMTKYPDRFTIQTNQLYGRAENTRNSAFTRILKYKDRVHNGFQNLAGFQGSADRQGTPEMTIYNFVLGGADYLEVWDEDGQNVNTTQKLLDLITEARQLGPEKFKEKLVREGKFRTADEDHYQPNQPGGKKK